MDTLCAEIILKRCVKYIKQKLPVIETTGKIFNHQKLTDEHTPNEEDKLRNTFIQGAHELPKQAENVSFRFHTLEKMNVVNFEPTPPTYTSIRVWDERKETRTFWWRRLFYSHDVVASVLIHFCASCAWLNSASARMESIEKTQNMSECVYRGLLWWWIRSGLFILDGNAEFL